MLAFGRMNVENAATVGHEPLDATPVLPVFPIVRAALRDLWRQRRAVLRFGAIPFSIGLVVHLAFLYLGMDHDRDPGTDLIVTAAGTAPYVLFTVPLLRYLLGEQDVKSGLRWETAHSVFVTWSIVESALLTTIGNLAGYLYAPFMLGFVYASARFTLVLPAVAVGEYPDLRLAWTRSRHNGWSLVGIRLVVWALAIIPAFGAAAAMKLLGVDWPDAFARLSFIMVIILESVTTATLAHCYYRSKSSR